MVGDIFDCSIALAHNTSQVGKFLYFLKIFSNSIGNGVSVSCIVGLLPADVQAQLVGS